MSKTESIVRSQVAPKIFGSRRLTAILHPASISFALIGILVTLFSAASLYRSEQRQSESRVQAKASQIEERARHRKLAGAQLARAASAYVTMSNSVSRDEWKNYCEILNKNETRLGIQGVGYLEKVNSLSSERPFKLPRFGSFSRFLFTNLSEEDRIHINASALIGVPQAEAMSSAYRLGDTVISANTVLRTLGGEDRSAVFVFHPIFEEKEEGNSRSPLRGFVFCVLESDEPITGPPGNLVDGEITAQAVPVSQIEAEILATSAAELRSQLQRTQNRSQSVKLLPLIIGLAGVAITLAGLLALSESRMIQERATKAAIKLAESLEIREREVIQLNAELEEKVEQRTAQLQSANAELQAFSYTLSHDLRSPVRHIDNLADAIREDCQLPAGHEAEQFLDRIRNSTNRMDQMITDILTLAGQANTEPKLQTLDLSSIAKETIEMLSEAHAEDGFKFQIAEEMSVLADRVMLGIVVQNLLENALKFSASTEYPEVRCGSISVEGGQVYFVSDNGCGFRMRHADKLFLPFKRLHRDKEITGSGIGMASVKKAITRHGGDILCQSEVSIGTTFYFTLDRRTNLDLDEVAELAATCEVRPILVRCSESKSELHHCAGIHETGRTDSPALTAT